jgi:16S rRNA (cytosine1402-N4)-methyltransferase
MAIRIALNDELGQLQRFLERFVHTLAPGARVVVITFHSLEDRLVKRRFRDLSRPGGDLPPGLPLTEDERPAAPYRLLTPKPIRPGDDEIQRNPRARSARLRGLMRRPEPGTGSGAGFDLGAGSGAGTGTSAGSGGPGSVEVAP